MAEIGQYGFDRRLDTEDPNAAHRVPPAAQVAVGGVAAPRTPDVSYISRNAQELALALGESGRVVGETFQNMRDNWRLEGQLEAAQGKTQEEIAANGNLYSVQGAQMYEAQSLLQEFQQEAMTNIDLKDHEVDPTAYRTGLSERFADISNKLSGNSVIRRFASEQAAQILPRVVAAQTAAHNVYAQAKLKDAYINNLNTSSGVIDPNDPHSGMEELSEKMEPGFSGLAEVDETEAWVGAAVLSLGQGRPEIYNVLGGPEGWESRNLSKDQIGALQTAYGNYQTNRKVDFTNEFSDAQTNIINQARINPDPASAAVKAQELIDQSRNHPSWASHVAYQTNAAAISAILDQRNPDNPAQSQARTQNIMQPGNFKRIADAYSAIAQGTLKGDNQTGVIRDIAADIGVSEQDVQSVFDAFEQTDDRLAFDTIAKVKSAVQSQLDAQTKLQTGQLALANENLNQFSSGDQGAAIAAGWQAYIGEGEAAIANKRYAGSPIQYAEEKMLPKLARMDIVDPSYKTSLTAAFNGAQLVNGTIDERAVTAYDTLVRMKGYGLSDYQLQQYLGGANSNASKLWAQANDFDLGDMDTPSALTAAKMLLDRKVDISMFQEQVEVDRIAELAEDVVSEKAGLLTRMSSYGFSGIWTSDVYSAEMERAAADPSFKGEIMKRAQIFKAYNPQMTATAASRMAADDVAGRVTYIAGQMIVGGKKTSVPQDMGLADDNPMAPNMAVMLWMRDKGEDAFGPAFKEFKVVGDDPEQSWFGHWTYGMVGQLSDSMDTSSRGAPQFKTRYDADSKKFIFTMYADQTENAEINSQVVVPAAEIGGYFQKQMKAKALDNNRFWDKVSTTYLDAAKAVVTSPAMPMPVMLQP